MDLSDRHKVKGVKTEVRNNEDVNKNAGENTDKYGDRGHWWECRVERNYR